MGRRVAGFVIGVAAVAALPGASSAQVQSRTVRVVLQNDDVVPADMAERARLEVVRLYKLIQVDIEWVADPAALDDRLRFVKVTPWEPRDDEFPMALGMTPAKPAARGTQSYVFWQRVQRYGQKYAAGFDMLLAVAIAHELGHMLLPERSHSRHGLMHASWDSGHFRSAAAGLLHFSPESAELIRKGLSNRIARDVERFEH